MQCIEPWPSFGTDSQSYRSACHSASPTTPYPRGYPPSQIRHAPCRGTRDGGQNCPAWATPARQGLSFRPHPPQPRVLWPPPLPKTKNLPQKGLNPRAPGFGRPSERPRPRVRLASFPLRSGRESHFWPRAAGRWALRCNGGAVRHRPVGDAELRAPDPTDRRSAGSHCILISNCMMRPALLTACRTHPP